MAARCTAAVQTHRMRTASYGLLTSVSPATSSPYSRTCPAPHHSDKVGVALAHGAVDVEPGIGRPAGRKVVVRKPGGEEEGGGGKHRRAGKAAQSSCECVAWVVQRSSGQRPHPQELNAPHSLARPGGLVSQPRVGRAEHRHPDVARGQAAAADSQVTAHRGARPPPAGATKAQAERCG